MDKPEFNLEHQYQLYLERVGLRDKLMPPKMETELRRAFFGACGQLLILLRDDVGELTEDEGFKVFEDLLEQVSNFWLVETKRVN